MQKSKIKDWYLSEFKDDELGEEINSEITFEGLFNDMDNYKSVYESLEVYCSTIRERVFVRLADIMDVDYDYVYEQWLLTDNK